MRLFYYILNLVMAALVLTVGAMAVQSCSGSDCEPKVEPGGMQGSARLGFTLTVSDAAIPAGSGVRSKATPSDGTYDPGSGYENYIDIDRNDFRFLFFSSESRYLGDIDVTAIVPVGSEAGYKRYVVSGTLPSEMTAVADFKVCVLANWKEYPVLSPGDHLEKVWTDGNAVYDFGDGTVSELQPIPLYGIKEFSGVVMTPGQDVSLDNIHLLRAYAKVEVNLDNTIYPVKSISVTRVSSKGYKAPAGVDVEKKYVHNAYEKDYVNTPHIPVAGVLENIPLRLVSGDDAMVQSNRKYVIYLPEYDNKSADATVARMKITYSDPAIREAYVDFKYYKATGVHAKDEAFDLLRNYWYRFNLTQGPVDLTVKVDVQPYAKVVLRPDFGLERDEEGYIIVRNNKGEVIKYIRTDGAELTLGPVDMPYYGVIQAVFDSKRRALLGYLPDGRMVYWNYNGEDQNTSDMTSWEIYTGGDGTVDVHLDEDYIKVPDGKDDDHIYHIDPFTQSFYDDKGRVIRRYVYNDNEAFESRTDDGGGNAVELVGYTGDKYGSKEIIYKDRNGKIYCRITVTVNPDGTETETYSNN